MKKILLQLLVLLMPALAFSQADSTAFIAPDTSYWKSGTTLNINVNQVSLTNWSAGGQNSVAFTGLSNSFLTYEKGKLQWATLLNLAYGMSKLGNKDFRKTDDKMYFQTTLSHKRSEKILYTVYLDFLSQFTNGYAYTPSVVTPSQDSAVLQSQFLSRAVSQFSLGMEYKPISSLIIFLSPATVKTTIVGNQDFANKGNFGVSPEHIDGNGNRVAGKNFLLEPGAMLNVGLNKQIMENITLQSRLNLFWAYIRKDYVTETYYLYKNVDVQWDVAFLMKVNKFINVSLTTSLIYDDDIKVVRQDGTTGQATQFKEVLSVGFNLGAKNRNAKLDDLKK